MRQVINSCCIKEVETRFKEPIKLLYNCVAHCTCTVFLVCTSIRFLKLNKFFQTLERFYIPTLNTIMCKSFNLHLKF